MVMPERCGHMHRMSACECEKARELRETKVRAVSEVLRQRLREGTPEVFMSIRESMEAIKTLYLGPFELDEKVHRRAKDWAEKFEGILRSNRYEGCKTAFHDKRLRMQRLLGKTSGQEYRDEH